MARCHRQMSNEFTRESARQQMEWVTKVHAECNARITQGINRFNMLNETHVMGEAAEQISQIRHRVVLATAYLFECRGQFYQFRARILSRWAQLRHENRMIAKTEGEKMNLTTIFTAVSSY